MDCDVWSGMYVDPDAGRNFTIEWYFTKVLKLLSQVDVNSFSKGVTKRYNIENRNLKGGVFTL